MESFTGFVSKTATAAVDSSLLQPGDRVTIEYEQTTDAYTVTVGEDVWTNAAELLETGLIKGQIQGQEYSFVICQRNRKLVGILYTNNSDIADPDPDAGGWEADEEGEGGKIG